MSSRPHQRPDANVESHINYDRRANNNVDMFIRPYETIITCLSLCELLEMFIRWISSQIV